MASNGFPSIRALASALKDVKRYCGDCNDGWVNVRLQVHNGYWALRSGDSSYDSDHRGYWGASSLSRSSNCMDVARDLISEAREDFAQSGDESALSWDSVVS